MRVQITENTIQKELAALKDTGPEVMLDFVSGVTRAIHREAVRGIQRGPASGRIYTKTKPKRTHQASAPGEYPMSDRGRLAGSVEFELPTNKTKIEGVVGTNLVYGKHLELKPVSRGGRPWLSRAYKTVIRRGLDKLLERTFKRHNKGSGK